MRGSALLILLLLIGWIIFGSWFWTCRVQHNCFEKEVAVASPTTTTKKPAVKAEPVAKAPVVPFRINGAGGSFGSVNDNLKFGLKNAQPEIPTAVDNQFNQLKDYLAKDIDKKVTITGSYKNGDPAPAGFKDLGIARATKVKDVLVGKGVKADQIELKSKVNNRLQSWKNKIIGGIDMAVSSKSGLLDKAIDFAKATADSFSSGSRIELKGVQFSSGSSKLRSTSYGDLDRLVKILNENKKLRIEVSGHTDNTGSLDVNNRLSTERALRVKDYLVSKGIQSNRLVHRGFGPAQPVANNATAEGRQSNRRVEVKVL